MLFGFSAIVQSFSKKYFSVRNCFPSLILHFFGYGIATKYQQKNHTSIDFTTEITNTSTVEFDYEFTNKH